MLFNSIEFAVFFGIVLTLYYALPYRYRPVSLLVASYVFYMAWRVDYLVLILLSTLLDYTIGIAIGRSSALVRKRLWLAASIVGNCSVLFIFKYWTFLGESVNVVAQSFGSELKMPVLDVLLPVGISFYTFQTMSYTIDVYRGVKDPEQDIVRFALYVSFFPQLVAGPIERSTRLLPQLDCRTEFSSHQVAGGMRLMLWGLFKKVVIADTLAVYVDAVYAAPSQFAGIPVLLATYAFAFQIYCDFSGYSDIAIGAARTLGIDLMLNFRQPYFARSVGEFWKRWHISLSTWFRDYLYIPLGGSRVALARWCMNIGVVFIVSGLWHGASWTFVVWGALHGVYLIFSALTGPVRDGIAERIGILRIPALRSAWQIFVTFHLVLVGWVFFRAGSFSGAFTVFERIGSITMNEVLALPAGINVAASIGREEMLVAACAVALLFLAHLAEERGRPPLESVSRFPMYRRWAVYAGFALAVLNLGAPNEVPFIYFQF